jgi:hypothetical protein
MSARYVISSVPPDHPPVAPIQLAAGDTLKLTFELTATETTTIEFAEMLLLSSVPGQRHTVRAVHTDAATDHTEVLP